MAISIKIADDLSEESHKQVKPVAITYTRLFPIAQVKLISKTCLLSDAVILWTPHSTLSFSDHFSPTDPGQVARSDTRPTGIQEVWQHYFEVEMDI